jgi:hypothetical protein
MAVHIKLLLVSGILLLTLSPCVFAQDDPSETPLGDVARSLRKKPASPDTVIDNDNLSKVVDDAASHRAAGTSMVFSFDPGSKNFHVSTPDVTCSLAFTGKTSSLLADPIELDELPRSELAKLEGPATIDGDSLQVSMHNGTSWDLRELVIGLTIVRRRDPVDASYHGPARILPVAASEGSGQMQESSGEQSNPGQPGQKQPDVTLLLRVKGSAGPAATAIFRTPLNFSLFPDQDWHWAIVRAKGIPPQDPAADTTAQLEQEELQSAPALPVLPTISPRTPPLLAPVTVLAPSNLPSKRDAAKR